MGDTVLRAPLPTCLVALVALATSCNRGKVEIVIDNNTASNAKLCVWQVESKKCCRPAMPGESIRCEIDNVNDSDAVLQLGLPDGGHREYDVVYVDYSAKGSVRVTLAGDAGGPEITDSTIRYGP